MNLLTTSDFDFDLKAVWAWIPLLDSEFDLMALCGPQLKVECVHLSFIEMGFNPNLSVESKPQNTHTHTHIN
jgi:hypothetical protein